jgi:hypothetical protein
VGSKGSRNLESNRPESGGADKNERFEKSGVLDRDKEKFASQQAKKEREKPAAQEEEEKTKFSVQADD